jgi:acyl-CoA synthetase (NDP forming)
MHDIISKAKSSNRNLLEPEARRLFMEYGLPVQPFMVTHDAAEAVRAAKELGFPAVLKVVSPDILHKSDVGGVRTRLGSAEEVAAAYEEMLKSVRQRAGQARIEGILVDPQAAEGRECIVGFTHDPQFGPVLMFGLGGIFVEVLKDVSFRLLPIDESDARDMVREIKGYSLLAGVRGQPPGDIPAVVDFLMKTARLVGENPEIHEIDVNPLFVYERGVLAIDARVILG